MDAHHVQHWCDGGETSLDNLITLCRHHHRLLHQEGYEIVKKNEDLVFIKPEREIFPRALLQQFKSATDAGETLAIQSQNNALGLQIDTHTAVTLWDGGECDYCTAVEALMPMEPEEIRNTHHASR